MKSRMSWRNAMLATSALGALSFGGAAAAQDGTVEEIVVVGSQIEGAKVTAALPVTVVDAAQARAITEAIRSRFAPRPAWNGGLLLRDGLEPEMNAPPLLPPPSPAPATPAPAPAPATTPLPAGPGQPATSTPGPSLSRVGGGTPEACPQSRKWREQIIDDPLTRSYSRPATGDCAAV